MEALAEALELVDFMHEISSKLARKRENLVSTGKFQFAYVPNQLWEGNVLKDPRSQIVEPALKKRKVEDITAIEVQVEPLVVGSR
jgi:hypothetical protein